MVAKITLENQKQKQTERHGRTIYDTLFGSNSKRDLTNKY
jgi:hypothetical protein